MGKIMKGIVEKAEDLHEQERMAKKVLYYKTIMEEEGCTMEEAIRSTQIEGSNRIGVKMIDYGLWNLKTKKGREKFANTQLTQKEIEIWNSPERPDNIAKLMIGAAAETKTVFKKIKH